MLNYLLKKILYSFLVLLGVISTVFFIFNVLPGDPARMVLGQRADISSIEAINKDLGRDKSLPVQFLLYLNDLSPLSVHSRDQHASTFFSNDKYGKGFRLIQFSNKELWFKTPYLRRSYQSKRKVTDLLLETLPGTAVLALSAMIFATVIGIILGIIAAVNKSNLTDNLIVFSSILGTSLPSFFAAIIIAWIFGFLLHQYTGLNMTGSLYEYDPFQGPYLSLKNLILPAFALGIRPLAIIVQLMRSSVLDELSKDYIKTARAKGLGRLLIIRRHLLPNALNPVITAISGWFASLMAGAFFIEYIFGWRGIGKVTVEALDKYDFPVVTGSVIFVACFFILINILVDILYALIDPRVNLE